MFHHYITKYKEDGVPYAEAWFQINIFGLAFCFSRRKIEIKEDPRIKEVTVTKKSDDTLITRIFQNEEGIKQITSDDYVVAVKLKDPQKCESND